MTDNATPRACLNCEATLSGQYCSSCGQKDRELDQPLAVLLHEWAESFLHFDQRVARTMKLLLTRPGELTREYLAGRRSSFVPPLKLYFIASLMMFFVVGWTGRSIVSTTNAPGENIITISDSSTVVPQEVTTDDDEVIPKPPATLAPASGDEVEVDPADEGWLVRALEGMSDPEALGKAMNRQVPKAMFIMLPVFAFLLHLAYRRRRRPFIHHLIYSLHVHTFAFLVATPALMIDYFASTEVASTMSNLLILWYYGISLKRVYEGKWRWTVLRATAVSCTYLVLVLMTLILTLAMVLLLGV